MLEKEFCSSSTSQHSCSAFIVNKHSEQKRDKTRLVINYKPLNKLCSRFFYPIPNKRVLFKQLENKKYFYIT